MGPLDTFDTLAEALDAARKANFRELKLDGPNQVAYLDTLISEVPDIGSQLISLMVSNGSPLIIYRFIAQVTSLKTLTLHECELNKFPEAILQMVDLEYMVLSANNLSDLPRALSRLQKLKIMDLQDNKFRHFPDAILGLKSLESLNLSDNPINFLPETIGRLTTLTSLSLYRTGLASLPRSISQLKSLKDLTLWNNNFLSIPSPIYELKSLEALSFSNTSTNSSSRDNNSIKTISPAILQLARLKRLDLEANPVEDPPPEVVSKGAEAIRSYFRQLQAKGKDYFFEAKLLIVGEGGAGKTTLAKKIDDENYQLKEEDSTKGIEVTKWSFSLETGGVFRVNIWDFGGQEIYHATHQFFLTKRSLYILLADTRKEDTDFYYWLNVVSLLTDNSPILIILNEKQDRHKGMNRAYLQGQFPNVSAFLCTNLASNRGLPEVRAEISRSIRALSHIGTPLPSTWVRVREELETDERNFIGVDEYLAICSKNGFSTLPDKLQLSGYLHDLGVCLHFQDDPILRKIVILKPKWGTDAVYKVLDNPTVIANLGQFGQSDLEDIWQEGQYASMRAELLQLMMNFNLCYQIRDSKLYMAPQLLADHQPEYEWHDEDNLTIRYVYDFMPKGIITRLIVQMHRFIAEQSLVWKSGVILARQGAMAEVREHYGKRELNIRVSGINQLELLSVVAYEIDTINSSYKGLRFNKMVPCNCLGCKASSIPSFYALDVLRKFVSDKQELIQCQASYSMVNVVRLLSDVNVSTDKVTNVIEAMSQVVFQGSVAQVVVQQAPKGVNMVTRDTSATQKPVKSAWANGSFYLFTFIIVIAGIGVAAKNIPFYSLPLLLLATISVVPLIGALQLRQDEKLAEKSFIQLIGMIFRQLPLIRSLAKKPKENKSGKS